MSNYPQNPPYNVNFSGYPPVVTNPSTITYGTPLPTMNPFQPQDAAAYPSTLPYPSVNPHPFPPPPTYLPMYPSLQSVYPNVIHHDSDQPLPYFSPYHGSCQTASSAEKAFESASFAPAAPPYYLVEDPVSASTVSHTLPPPYFPTLPIPEASPSLATVENFASMDETSSSISVPSPLSPPYDAQEKHSTSLHTKPEYEGTVKPCHPFDPKRDATIIKRAVIGSDEKLLTGILANRTQAQRMQIAEIYRQLFGKKLVKDIKSEFSGQFKETIRALMMSRERYLTKCIRTVIVGIGSLKRPIFEILSTSTNSEIQAINKIYQKEFKSSLERDIKRETSGYFRILIVKLNAAVRDESMHVDHSEAKEEAKGLRVHGSKHWATGGSPFTNLLILRSFSYIQCVFSEYHKLCNHTIEETLKKEFSGDLLDCLLALVACIRSMPTYFAKRLHTCLKKHTTTDTLIHIIVSRSEVDLKLIKNEYQRLYKKSVLMHINNEISGDFKRVLLEILKD